MVGHVCVYFVNIRHAILLLGSLHVKGDVLCEQCSDAELENIFWRNSVCRFQRCVKSTLKSIDAILVSRGGSKPSKHTHGYRYRFSFFWDWEMERFQQRFAPSHRKHMLRSFGRRGEIWFTTSGRGEARGATAGREWVCRAKSLSLQRETERERKSILSISHLLNASYCNPKRILDSDWSENIDSFSTHHSCNSTPPDQWESRTQQHSSTRTLKCLNDGIKPQPKTFLLLHLECASWWLNLGFANKRAIMFLLAQTQST